jgi:hypothetical protein
MLTPLGPLAAGLLLGVSSPRETIAAFTLVNVALVDNAEADLAVRVGAGWPDRRG